MNGMNEPIDPRVLFAAERTMLAWIRTGVAMMGFGFVVGQLVDQERLGALSFPVWVAVVLILAGAVMNILAGSFYVKTLRRLRQNSTLDTGDWPPGRLIGLGLALLGLILTLYLLFSSR
jgi:putative membrane protein